MKKIIFILFLFLSCYIIYNGALNTKYYYLSLGDSLSGGINIYGLKQYGYSDYLKDYLSENNLLEKYDNTFTDKDYRIIDLIKMIEYNEEISINGKKTNINQSLKKADIITLSIGMNELYYKLNINNENIYNYMIELLNDMEKLLQHIAKYNHKKVYVLGYYNIGTNQEYINYINIKLENITLKYNFEYVDLSKIFNNNPIYFDKKDSFIPNNAGYLKISKIIIEKLKNNWYNIERIYYYDFCHGGRRDKNESKYSSKRNRN